MEEREMVGATRFERAVQLVRVSAPNADARRSGLAMEEREMVGATRGDAQCNWCGFQPPILTLGGAA